MLPLPALQTQQSSCGGLLLVKPNGTYSVAAPFVCDQSKVVKIG